MKKAAKFASPMAITGFADFECKLDSVKHESGNFTDALASNKTFTNKKQMHQIVSFSLVFVDTNGKLLYEKAYCGENAGEYFFQNFRQNTRKSFLNYMQKQVTFRYSAPDR